VFANSPNNHNNKKMILAPTAVTSSTTATGNSLPTVWLADSSGKIGYMTMYSNLQGLLNPILQMNQTNKVLELGPHLHGARLYSTTGPTVQLPERNVDGYGNTILFYDESPIFTTDKDLVTNLTFKFTQKLSTQDPTIRDPNFVYTDKHLNIVDYNPHKHGPVPPSVWPKLRYQKSHPKFAAGYQLDIEDA